MTLGQAQRLQFITRWHRRLAILVMAWLTVLAISGIVINHAHDWGLDRRALPGPLQYWLYGIEGSGRGYCTSYPDTGGECNGIFARLALRSGSLLLGENSLFLLDEDGGLVEKLPLGSAGLTRLEAGFSDDSHVYLRGPGKVVRTDPDLLRFQAVSEPESEMLQQVAWQEQKQRPEPISWERFLLDLHAARFLGPLAKTFNDLSAGLILLLVASGTWLYWRRRKVNGH